MFRDLARMTASLKGPRYEGALIAKAVWEREHDAGAGMRVLRDHHGLLGVMAFDESGRLTLTMLLGRPAPSRPSGQLARSRSLTLLVDGAPTPAHLSLCFSAESVHAFVQSVGDTNALHAGPSRLCRGWPSSKPRCRASRRCAVRSCASAAHPLPERRSSCPCSSACKRWKHYLCPALHYTSTRYTDIVDNKIRLSYNKGHVQYREN